MLTDKFDYLQSLSKKNVRAVMLSFSLVVLFCCAVLTMNTKSYTSLSAVADTSVVNKSALNGNYRGTLALIAPANLGVMDFEIQLSGTEDSSTGTVLDTNTSHYSTDPQVHASVTSTTDSSPAKFTIQSDPFTDVIAEYTVTRSFTIEGEVLDNGRILSGVYSETIEGYTHEPMQIEGNLLLSKPAISRIGSVALEVSAVTVEAGDSINITATVVDLDGQPLSGEPVTFFGSFGNLNPDNGVTDAQGQVTAQYMAGTDAGIATLQALAGSFNGSAEVRIEGKDVNPPLSNSLYLPIVNIAAYDSRNEKSVDAASSNDGQNKVFIPFLGR